MTTIMSPGDRRIRLRVPPPMPDARCGPGENVGDANWYTENIRGYGPSQATVAAQAICVTCPHRDACAEWGIERETFGVWGGLTPADRRRIRKARRGAAA